jgi:hypothetical protein
MSEDDFDARLDRYDQAKAAVAAGERDLEGKKEALRRALALVPENDAVADSGDALKDARQALDEAAQSLVKAFPAGSTRVTAGDNIVSFVYSKQVAYTKGLLKRVLPPDMLMRVDALYQLEHARPLIKVARRHDAPDQIEAMLAADQEMDA